MCGVTTLRSAAAAALRACEPRETRIAAAVCCSALFGEPGEGPRVSVTMRDARCSMVNFDPDSGRSAPEVLKSIVRTNQNNAGIYGTVVRTGRLATGQTIRLQELAEK